jgi:hypothetical protein
MELRYLFTALIKADKTPFKATNKNSLTSLVRSGFFVFYSLKNQRGFLEAQRQFFRLKKGQGIFFGKVAD